MKITIEYHELKKFMDYLEDKTEDVYKREVQKSIERFLQEYTTKK